MSSSLRDVRIPFLHGRGRSLLIGVFCVAILGVLLSTLLSWQFAHAANLSLRLSKVAYSNRTITFAWNTDSNVTTFNLIAANRPDMSGAIQIAQRLAGGSSSYSQTLDSSVGYRYFQLQAYDAGGKRLSTSNVVGIAKYATGVMLAMKTDSALRGQYATYNDTCYSTPVWFITNDSTTGAYSVGANFQLSEFLHSEGYASAVVDPMMVQHVQNIRNAWGSVLSITSGFRTPAHNATLSGSATCSTHTVGQAVDIAVDSYNQWLTLKGYAEKEGASYIEPWQPDVPHLHADWRSFYDNPPYTNW